MPRPMSAAEASPSGGVQTVERGAANRFYVWPCQAKTPAKFDPHALARRRADTDVDYFYGVAAHLDHLLGGRGLTFLLTWHLDAFTEPLRDAVVVLIGDEKYQTPSYARHVRAVFKTGGTRPNPLADNLRLPPAVAWRVLLRELRNSVLARRRRVPGPCAPMFAIPMGVFGLREVEWMPFDERPTDVFFAGSIEDGQGFTIRPRLAARRQMAAALEAARSQLPIARVDCTTSGPFANPQNMLDERAYSSRLMRSKIALCPRGNFDETFRLSEAAKSGCVAVTERLPARWYYRDAPAIELDSWRELPETLAWLLADPQALSVRAGATRRWWNERLSERGTAQLIAGVLTQTDLIP